MGNGGRGGGSGGRGEGGMVCRGAHVGGEGRGKREDVVWLVDKGAIAAREP